MVKNITVIGSGVMGSGIAQSFAMGGYAVVVNDIAEKNLVKAKQLILDNLSLLAAEGVLSEKKKQDAAENLIYMRELAEAVREADVIIEVIPEVIELKWDLYQKLDALIGPETIIASNTSTFPISTLAEKTKFPERMIITHFFNPGHLVPLVEIVKHQRTREDVVDITINLIRSIGKTPVLLKKEISGFIANRLQTALMREAFYLLEEGVASAEDIDAAVTTGPGFRWAFTGPIEIADFGGLDTWQRVFENVAPALDQSIEAPKIIRQLVEENKLGTKTGEGIFSYDAALVPNKIRKRDRQLIQLERLKNKEDH